VDPFTGGSRYQPNSARVLAQDISEPTPQPSTLRTQAALSILPASQPLSFKQANVSAMKSKLISFNNDLADSALVLSDGEIKVLDDVFTALTAGVATRANAINLSQSDISVISNLAGRWPSPQCFPVIDLARLVCAYTPDAISRGSLMTELFQHLAHATELDLPWTSPLEKHRDVNTLLFLRSLANAIHGKSTATSVEWITTVLNLLEAAPYPVFNKNQRIALATCVFNLSTVALGGSLSTKLEEIVHKLLVKILDEEREDSETYYRALVAFGNITYAALDKNAKLNKDRSNKVIEEARSRFEEKRIADVAGDLWMLVESV